MLISPEKLVLQRGYDTNNSLLATADAAARAAIQSPGAYKRAQVDALARAAIQQPPRVPISLLEAQADAEFKALGDSKTASEGTSPGSSEDDMLEYQLEQAHFFHEWMIPSYIVHLIDTHIPAPYAEQFIKQAHGSFIAGSENEIILKENTFVNSSNIVSEVRCSVLHGLLDKTKIKSIRVRIGNPDDFLSVTFLQKRIINGSLVDRQTTDAKFKECMHVWKSKLDSQMNRKS